MNTLQEKIYSVIKAIVEIDDFENYYDEHAEAIAEKQQLTPYSFRHRFAYVGHNRKKPDGTYRAPKQIADAMGHTLDVHLKSYARFMSKELAQNFDKELVEAVV